MARCCRKRNSPRSKWNAPAVAEKICQTLLAPPPSDTLAAMTAMRTEFMQNKLPGAARRPAAAARTQGDLRGQRHASPVHLGREARRAMSPATSAAAAATWRCGNRARFSRRCAAAAPAPAWQTEITVIATRGDLDQSPLLVGKMEKGFFTRELELALLDRRIDLVVHSLKDLPTAEPEGLSIARSCRAPPPPTGCWCGANSTRPRDDGLLPLAAGARVGASSLRRGALLGRFAPQAMSVPLRGNVPTRLRKLGEGADRRCHRAGGRRTHAPEARSVRVRGGRAAARVVDPGARPGSAGRAMPRGRPRNRNARSRCSPIADCVGATRWEREFLRVIEGGCSTPFGCYVAGDRAHLGIATERGWAAHSIDLPTDLLEDSQRDSFIRDAVAGCQPVDTQKLSAHARPSSTRALRR